MYLHKAHRAQLHMKWTEDTAAEDLEALQTPVLETLL